MCYIEVLLKVFEIVRCLILIFLNIAEPLSSFSFEIFFILKKAGEEWRTRQCTD